MQNFKAALTAYNTKNFQKSLDIIDEFKLSNLDAHLLKAASLTALNKNDKAIEIYQFALKNSPKSTPLLENYTGLLCKLGDFISCLNLLNTTATTVSPKLTLNKLEALIKLGHLLEAKKLVQLINTPTNLEFRFLWLKIELHEALGELDIIENIINKLPEAQQNNVYISYKRACNLRNLGRFNEALDLLLNIEKKKSTAPEVLYLIGCIYKDLNNNQQCERYLNQCLTIAPYYVPAHESLNKLYYSTKNNKLFLSSYKLVKQKYEPHPVIEHSFISQLIKSDSYESALDVSTNALKLFPNDQAILHAHSVVLGKLNDHEKAFNLLNQLVKKAPHESRYRIDLANYLIMNGDYINAIVQLESALKYDYFNQEVWAYLSTAWRLSANDKYHWLTNYDQYVKVFELKKPKGYSTSGQFFENFTDLLLNLHAHSTQLLDQSVRSGSQTEGHLLFRSNKLINDFKHSMNNCITSYLANLPKDQSHPLCSRNNNAFKVNGSWSVKLGNKGFHANHIHPAGWLSAPSYISLPNELNENDTNKSGWLKLGETCLNLKEREEIARSICPKTGQMIIFPSYIWHGTYPLKSTQPRLTVPCDVMPIL